MWAPTGTGACCATWSRAVRAASGTCSASSSALAILIAMAEVIAVLLLLPVTYMQGAIYGMPVASPLRGNGLQDLVSVAARGLPGPARARGDRLCRGGRRAQPGGRRGGRRRAVRRSRAIITTILTVFTLAGSLSRGGFSGGLPTIGPEWFQFLPISMGSEVFNALPGSTRRDWVAATWKAFPAPGALLDRVCRRLHLSRRSRWLIALIALRRQQIV